MAAVYENTTQVGHASSAGQVDPNEYEMLEAVAPRNLQHTSGGEGETREIKVEGNSTMAGTSMKHAIIACLLFSTLAISIVGLICIFQQKQNTTDMASNLETHANATKDLQDSEAVNAMLLEKSLAENSKLSDEVQMLKREILDQQEKRFESFETNMLSALQNISNSIKSDTKVHQDQQTKNLQITKTSMLGSLKNISDSIKNDIEVQQNQQSKKFESFETNMRSALQNISDSIKNETEIQRDQQAKNVESFETGMLSALQHLSDGIKNDIKFHQGCGRLGSVSNPAKSCLHLRQNGQNASGIFSIQVDNTSSPIKVFCDMESAGGGWTLVASVHENNINGKCTQGDLWSSDQGHGHDSRRNWQNFYIFGSPEWATRADYKSQAYYALQASDMMIWHVPNDVEIRRASEEASLKYRTTTSFLEDYGGNLRSLFDDHFPLEREELPGSVLSALSRASSTIRSRVPGFYDYVYDNPTNNSINDGGGHDMFDGGNKVFYGTGGTEEIWITYNEIYRNASIGVEFVSSSNQHPFHALMWIENGRGTQQSYSIRVLDNPGSDGSGSYRTLADTLTDGVFSLTYHAYNVYGAGDPSICKVFYYVQSNSWGSIVSSVSRSPWTGGTSELNHGLIFTGAPKFLLVGYTLLSRANGAEVTNSYIRSALNVVFSVLPNKMHCGKGADSLVQPVVFLKGNNEQIAEGIPQSIKADTSPGFIQFRVRNWDGFPNALCPGVKTTSCHPESVCVGGINTMPESEEICGDFSGWQGKKSSDDINSSILIFTRGRE